MKLNKLFASAMCIATLATIGCQKQNPPIINPGDGGDEEITMPIVNAPEAGKTTIVVYVPENTHANGIYGVGTINAWKEKDTETCKFTKIEGEDRWYQLTVDWASDMAVKVLAIPSKPELAAWGFQWGKNVDADDPDPEITEDNVVVLAGDVELVLENQGEPKATNFADGGVVFFQIKAWKADPNIQEQPATAISFKHPWNGGDWVYKEAEAKGNNVFELEDYYGGNGFNVMDQNKAEAWYEKPTTIYEGATVGDKIIVRFTSRAGSADGDLDIILVEKGQAPEVTPVVVTVRAKWPSEWTGTPTAWVWPTGGEGSEVVLEKDGDFYKYTTPEAVPGLNIIFKNGEGWTSDANQTEDVKNVVADTDYQITYNEGKKATVTVIE